jgi:hypothetical protein
MDFDHRPGEEKLFNVSRFCVASMQLVLAEVAKCDLVCSNCHRIRTIKRLRERPQLPREKFRSPGRPGWLKSDKPTG